MTIHDRTGLQRLAWARLSETSYHPGKLALLHTGAAAAFSLILMLLNHLLSQQIADTGGLSAVGLQAGLSTAQTMLSITSLVVAPFWDMGFVYATVRIARGEHTEPATLLRGFQRFGPVLRLQLLQGILYAGIAFFSIQLSSGIYMLTPFATPLMEAVQTIPAEELTVDAIMAAAAKPEIMIPMYVVAAAVTGALMIPVYYRFRLAQFLIVDDPKIGALMALGMSNRLMRRNRWAMFRLDLRFWWFYGLQLVSAALCYGDVLAGALGIQLPVSETVAFFGFFLLHCVVQLVLAWFAVSPVKVTYAVSYDVLRQMAENPAPLPAKPVPWDYPVDDKKAE